MTASTSRFSLLSVLRSLRPSAAFLSGFATAAALAGAVLWSTQVHRMATSPGTEASGTAASSNAPRASTWNPMTSSGRPVPTPVAARPSGPGGPMPVDGHHQTAGMSQGLEASLAPIRARLAADPNDLEARKEAAVLLLRGGLLIRAFEEADEILRRRPGDVDGLYVHGVVRVAMGQGFKALELLDQVLETRPDHVGARLARGKALVKMGNVPMAVSDWEQGLAQAGGRHRELESLLAKAKSGAPAEEILASMAAPFPTDAG